MSQSITTSIRLSHELREELEYIAQKSHRGKNWIIVEALKEYLQKHNQKFLLEAARQQSLLASSDEQDEQIWEDNIDDSNWRN